ncbi:hypothetical protein DICVIV_00591 [Dictyocaulus viviparus]|uniref:Uncharacterized protein n=1 Tax=Dictyocaulus viviparus TaxID=29172 RepID=A0A0D8Y981_DICVI|nr:hypothetical protein DICVIV_00591 [Dictyocaulus viviparus]
MGNAIYTDQLTCYSTLEECKSHCNSASCVFADKCNGSENKYTCLTIDFRFITWLMFGCFLIVLIVCSSLVSCYVCRAVRSSLRWQTFQRSNRDVIFNHPGPIHHIQMEDARHKVPPPTKQRH